jgi:hydroxymethylpyrimidine/phosphomethylpyrimidine kinase
MNGRVLIVAGSDSSAGAGIQADLKTVMALGGYATTAITAVTAQNTSGVTALLPLGPDVVRRQIEAVLMDIGADAIKTGMLVDAAIVETVADTLEKLAPDVPLVVDPVIAATSGATLLDEPGIERLKRRLITRAAVVTPNVPEAALLTGLVVADLDGMRRAADTLLRLGARAVVVKGGHLPGDTLTDLVATAREHFVFTAQRQRSHATHGTGCTYASAIAIGLAQSLTLRAAVERAHACVQQAIRNAPGLGKGSGPLGHTALAVALQTEGKQARRGPLRRRTRLQHR